MKKINYILIIYVAILSVSCNKSMLDTTAKDQIDANNFFNNATDLQVYTNGFYEMLSQLPDMD